MPNSNLKICTNLLKYPRNINNTFEDINKIVLIARKIHFRCKISGVLILFNIISIPAEPHVKESGVFAGKKGTVHLRIGVFLTYLLVYYHDLATWRIKPLTFPPPITHFHQPQ